MRWGGGSAEGGGMGWRGGSAGGRGDDGIDDVGGDPLRLRGGGRRPRRLVPLGPMPDTFTRHDRNTAQVAVAQHQLNHRMTHREVKTEKAY